MTYNLILIILSILICFLLHPAIIFILYHRNITIKDLIAPFVCGVFLYLLCEYLLVYLSQWFSIRFLTSIYSSGTNFGIMNGLFAGGYVEVLRMFLLFFCSYQMKWIVSNKRFTLLGLFEGWTASITVWGVTLINQIRDIVYYGSLDEMWMTSEDMFYQLMEIISATLLYIGLTFIIKYALSTNTKWRYMLLNVGIHVIISTLLYYLPYVFGLPLIVAEAVNLLLCAGVCYTGCVLNGLSFRQLFSA